MINIILSGGAGTRLWPLSRKLQPKQFYKLFNNKSLFQDTVSRNRSDCKKQLIVLSNDNYFMAIDQLEEIDITDAKFLIEPVGKSTAPAIALACMGINPEEIVLVTPSDHMVKNLDIYHELLKKAKNIAEQGYLVTFGIKPSYAETGFGYIEADGDTVVKFHEKPEQEKAEKYIQNKNYFWNSGIFVFKAGLYLDELKNYDNEVYRTCKSAFENSQKHSHSSNPIKIELCDMEKIPEISIDISVMEKSKRVKVLEADIGWADLGSFDSMYEMLPKDETNSTFMDNFHTLSTTKISNEQRNINLDSKNNLIFSSNRSIVAVDVENMIIVDTPDALLITKKGSSQRVKEVVDHLRTEESELQNIHLTVHRPWGTYTILEESDRYKIKRIVVKSGKRLSLQRHYHRSEHWIVVSGTARVRAENVEKIVKANESFYVPLGSSHRLENPGKIPLIMIEVQVGEYLGEDDIERIEDDFKRV